MTDRKTGAGKGSKSGPFSQVAEIIREHRGFPIPCGGDDGKTPLVAWERMKTLPSRTTLEDWRVRFGSAGVGVLTGPSRLTVVDLDDAHLLDDAREEFGDTALIVLSPRGAHLYFRSTGEKTTTRLDGAPIDVRGIGGFIVGPPTIRPDGGSYRFLLGTWAELDRLPPPRPGSLPTTETTTKLRTIAAGEMVKEGGRNDALFREMLRVATQCETESELAFRADGFNASLCDPPISDAELRKIVRSIWHYKAEGRLWVGGTARATFTREEIYALADDADAMALLALLRVEHGGRNGAFSISPEALTENEVLPGWTKYRYRRARDVLVKLGEILCIHEGGSGPRDPFMYVLAKGQKFGPNITRHPPCLPGGGWNRWGVALTSSSPRLPRCSATRCPSCRRRTRSCGKRRNGSSRRRAGERKAERRKSSASPAATSRTFSRAARR